MTRWSKPRKRLRPLSARDAEQYYNGNRWVVVGVLTAAAIFLGIYFSGIGNCC